MRRRNFLAALPLSALWGLASPATQSLITQQVSADAQGRVQGALMSLVSLTGIFAPLMFAGVFSLFIGPRAPLHLPGAPWLLAGAWLALIIPPRAPTLATAFTRPGEVAAVSSGAYLAREVAAIGLLVAAMGLGLVLGTAQRGGVLAEQAAPVAAGEPTISRAGSPGGGLAATRTGR